MKNKKWIILTVLIVLAAAAAFILKNVISYNDDIDAFSGATPLALEEQVPDGLSFHIKGKVKHVYQFTSRSFLLLAKTRIRTFEVSPEGEIMGAYIYTGIPVHYIMEGIVPEKEETDAFDRPLDMVVEFVSTNGKTARFSYGELTCANDSLPVTLAYHRTPLLPAKNPETHSRNKYKGNITGLRLICPREPDTSRYLDNVLYAALTVPETPDHLLPPMKKNSKCTSPSITCIEGNSRRPASYDNVPIIEISNWFRIGHGRGIKGNHPATASGYHLPTFLKRNFPGLSPDDFFLFVGCDGYRGIYSGREIFGTDAGNSFIIMETMNGKPPKGGKTIAAASDFFLDRCVWGLSHIVRLMENT